MLCIVLGVAPSGTVLAPYADPVIFVFVGSFILAEAMRSSGLDRRFALALLRHEWATRTPGRLLAALGAVTCAISLCVSNTATTAMMLPLGPLIRLENRLQRLGGLAGYEGGFIEHYVTPALALNFAVYWRAICGVPPRARTRRLRPR
jgi:Na+/H+ antiporter NhaD/arsenite permease-like protein